MNYYNEELDSIIKRLKTSKEDGLSNEEAKDLLNKYGKNELPRKKEESIFKIFISQFNNPIEIILVITAILSFFIGEIVDASALTMIILIDVIIGTYEEYKAKKDSLSLLNMIKVNSKVIRDSKEKIIDSSLLVKGDIVLFESGDKISSDCRIIESSNLQVDESLLTGESVNILKNNEVLEEAPLAERVNMLYAGTSVITGRAKAIVVETGINTEIGKIASNVNNAKEEKSPLTIRIEKFSKQISVIIIVIAIIISLILISRGYEVNEIFLCVIALCVSAMPEGLPLALTMALTIASKRMLSKNVIVKKLNSVESLGSCTVIASDKTGTLTVNEQTAKKILLSDGSEFDISGVGYNNIGEVTPVGKSNILDAKKIAMLGCINNEAHLEYRNDKWVSFGDSIDIAFLSLGLKLNIEDKPKVVEIVPYESENQYSAVFYELDGELRCTVKGSLEKVMSFSNENELYIKQNTLLTGSGYRVIAIADGKVSGVDKKNIKDLDFIGMVSFIDPIREEVKDSLKECKDAGIKVVMITGDHPLTAFEIGKELGLCKNYDEVCTYKDLEEYRNKTDEEFDNYISSIKVFARVTPMDKLDIVSSFKRQGEFVAVTGDGVNDAPAIKAANIGIAMGSGTDVAKDTASMIVIDDNFKSIVEGVKEGRCAYSNIRKITLFLLGCGLSEVLFFILSILFNFDMPLIAIQLLWLNVVTDGLQDIALSFEKPDKYIMNEKPRDTKESLFTKDLIMGVLVRGITITLIVFITWKYLMSNNYDIVLSRSIIMMLMVIIQNLDVYNCRSERKSIFSSNLFTNKIMVITVLGSIVLQLLMTEIPLTANLLSITSLPISTIFITFLLSLIVVIVFEIYKFIFYRNK